jgi:hypothetical protein
LHGKDTIKSFILPEEAIQNAQLEACYRVLRSIDYKPTATMANNLIAEISRLDLKDVNTPASASITDVQHLSSYK